MYEETLDSIIKAAYAGEELHGIVCDLSDFHLHTCLMQLYRDFADGKITKEKAAELKAKMVAAWQSDKDTLAAYRNFTAEFNENIRKAQQTGIHLHKADTLRKFAEDAAAVIETLTGDVGLCVMVSKLQ